jgi:putative endonuclease
MLIKLVIIFGPAKFFVMKRFVYIITDRNRNNLHVGLCSDLLQTLEFYSQMPTLFFDNSRQLNRLVYFEEINTEEQAMERFKYVSTFTRSMKEKMIRSVNPDWIDLTVGLNAENEMRVRARRQMRPAVSSARRAVLA